MAIGPFIARLQQFENVLGFHFNRLADFLNSTVDYSGIFSLQITNGHFGTTSSVPTLGALQTGVASQSISGGDTLHIVTITTTGSPPGVGAQVFIVNYANAWTAAPVINIMVNSGSPSWGICNPSGISGYTYVHGGTSAGVAALAASTTYKYGVFVAGAGNA